MSEQNDSGMPHIYGLVINLDERGYFDADLRRLDDSLVMSVNNEIRDDNDEIQGYGVITLVEDGFMDHGRDCEGLCNYAISIGLIPEGSVVHSEGAFYELQAEFLSCQLEDAAPTKKQSAGMRLG